MSMKRYSVTVNGSTYDVVVEEAEFASAGIPAGEKSAANKTKPVPPSEWGDVKIVAPMPGNIVNIKCEQGGKVQNGDVIAVLEAMKMENDIIAPSAGTIISINVNKGDSVDTGTLLITMTAEG